MQIYIAVADLFTVGPSKVFSVSLVLAAGFLFLICTVWYRLPNQS
jgi:hypothetical protein